MVYFLLYDAALALFLALGFPFLWRRIRQSGEVPGDWRERFGVYSPDTLRQLAGGRWLWVQAVSVGELLAVEPLLERLAAELPGARVLISVTTKTARALAARKFPAIPCIYFPFDFSLVVRRALSAVRPEMIVLVETELWPNLTRLAYDRDIPVVLVNGRISPNSYRWYKKFAFFLRRVLPRLSAAAMRTAEESRRLRFLGAPADRVIVAGSIKFDTGYQLNERISPEAVRRRFGISPARRVLVFGSLHPWEEEPALPVVLELRRRQPDVLIVIVPRWLDRTRLYGLLETGSVPFARVSRLPADRDAGVWIVDAYGELNNFYSICTAAFVGGTLAKWGGQNPIEPAAFGKPVVCGPHIWHFADEWAKLTSGGGGIEVNDYAELQAKLLCLLAQPERAAGIGRRARQVVADECGATGKNLDLIRICLRRE